MTASIGFKPDTSTKPLVFPFYNKPTSTFSYIVQDPCSKSCAIIDSVLDIDYPSGTLNYDDADEIIAKIKKLGLIVEWIIETHVHADHISAAPYIQDKVGGKLGIGEKITDVQTVFGDIFNVGLEFQRDGSQFDHLFSDGDSYQIGEMTAHAIHTPGHTPACMTHVIGDAAFVGDTLFMPDGGTARADFPGGDARTLYDSIQKVLSLPLDTRLFMCHDYAPDDREIEYETTVAKERAENIHVHTGVSEDAFVKMREARDVTLGMPRLILPSLQVNMRAGIFPPAEDNKVTYLKIPINLFK